MSASGPRPDPVSQLLKLSGPRPRVVVAFSGGLDSTVLAHALARGRRRFAGLRLLHVDHRLQSASREWAIHCERQANRWRVPIDVLVARIHVGRSESPEAAAREARYGLLCAALAPGEVLVTAQHLDDQAETLLLQLLRGAGVAGLAAMPPIIEFGPGRLARPLLATARADLERYARHHQLTWIDDPSNADTRFARNHLRHEVLPALRRHWPAFESSLARTARHMAEAQSLLDSVARADLARAMDGAGLHVASLRALPAERRRNALRKFIVTAGVEVPSTAQLREISETLLAARADARPEVRWSGGSVRRQAGRLELHAVRESQTETVAKSWRWHHERECVVSDAGDRLALVEDAAGPIDLDRLPAVLALRPRVGGETLRPGPRSRRQSVKKLLQAARIPPVERARLPFLFTGEGPKGRLVAVGDRWIDASIAANVKSRRRARLRFTRA